MFSKKSILFINPDYHCTFVYAQKFQEIGWKTKIIVGPGYPENLLYSRKGIIQLKGAYLGIKSAYFGALVRVLTVLFQSLFHHYIFYYGDIDAFSFYEKRIGLSRIFGNSYCIHFSIFKFLGKKIIYLPSGCMGEETKENFSKLDSGNVCGNCGWSDQICNDRRNIARFDIVRRYVDMMIGTGTLDTSQFKAAHFKYKSIDLDKWKPDLFVPAEFQLEPTQNVRIMHPALGKERLNNEKNIKGSPHVFAAVERLKSEGYAVELFSPEDIKSSQMRFYQAQMDIIVDQLIYGWWGSTGIEAMAIGKPMICYLRPSWKKFFFNTFPEYHDLPVIEANTSNIYQVLKRLITNEDYRRLKGEEAREFSELHFDPQKNMNELVTLIEKL